MKKASELEKNKTLYEKIEVDNDLKSLIVNYTGNLLKPDDDTVTLEMVMDTLAGQFPELMLAAAEENWVRGYKQGLQDSNLTKNLGVDPTQFGEDFDGTD